MDKIYHFSAPGRTELGGNHTDHQHGCVLAAAIDLEMTAKVSLTGTDTIRVCSQGYTPFEIQLSQLTCREDEKGTTAALVRGVAAEFQAMGAILNGFDMEISSQVLPGSGLSSSAAFEVLVATIFNRLFFGNRLTPEEIAKLGQRVENTYFGKPCGLMDQMACSVGGLVFIDFGGDVPQVERLDFDFRKAGYALCIIDTGADHADLTDEYAAITRELAQLCRLFDKDYLRQIPEEDFMDKLPQLRGQVSDRALLRAIHVYRENRRVVAQKEAIKAGKMAEFWALVKASGQSSWMYLQNICPAGAIDHQPVALALAMCDSLLNGKGAFRVHGGGFAGTVQAYVPIENLQCFVAGMEKMLGSGCCKVVNVRNQGGTEV